jgi:hypothetical protein
MRPAEFEGQDQAPFDGMQIMQPFVEQAGGMEGMQAFDLPDIDGALANAATVRELGIFRLETT